MEKFLNLFQKKIYIFALLLVMAVSGFLYLHNLGKPYITLWDEAAQVNVIKNLSNHCCVATLLPEKLDTDFRNWTDNYVWLHKPLLPFYINAGFYKVLGKTLWALRLPAVLAAELIALLLFYIGKRHFSHAAGLLAASLFLFNNYTFELVQGRQFSGLPDLLFALFCLLGLLMILEIFKNPQKENFLFFGAAIALAYYCKGGLAALPFGILAIFLLFTSRSKKILLNYAYAALIFLALIAPATIYLALRFPAEFAYEQNVQLAHVYSSVEYWGRPIYYYFTVYSKDLFGLAIAVLTAAAAIYGLFNKKTSPKIFLLALWMFGFFIPLSLMVSKISNFAYAAVPVAFLLVAAVVMECWEKINFKISNKLVKNFIILIFILALIYLFASSTRRNWQSSNFIAADAAVQEKLRQTALLLNPKLPAGSIVLTNIPQLDRSNLFYLYWSNFTALEVYHFHPISFLLERLPKNRPIFVVSSRPIKGYKLEKDVPSGYLYRLR